MAETLLVISGPGVPPYSARGLTQTLDPVASVISPTVNGGLLDLTPPQFRKYLSTISCTDVDPPAWDNFWPGMIVTVDCVAELGYPTVGGSPTRTVVPGSSRVSGAYTWYRPRLDMMVLAYTTSRDEYGDQVAWHLDLREV